MNFTEYELTTLTNGLRVAAERFAEDAKELRAEPKMERLAEQFYRQQRESLELANRLEEA